jgi:hypothetical protein
MIAATVCLTLMGTLMFFFGYRRLEADSSRAFDAKGHKSQKQIWILIAFGSVATFGGISLGCHAAVADSSAQSACDDVMFSAAHPGLDVVDLSRPLGVARQFLHDVRELSTADACNQRSWKEALGRASPEIEAQFSERMQSTRAHEFLKRRESEIVEIEIVSEEPIGSDAWSFGWIEHVKTPRGQLLRVERYGGLVRVQAEPHEQLRVTEFNWHSIDDASLQ